MKRIVQFLFIAFAFPVLTYGQDLGKQLDYQYKRTDVTYHSFAIYVDNEQEKGTLNLLLTTTFDLDDFQRLSTDLGTKIPFKTLRTKVENDEKSFHNVLLRIDLSKIAIDNDCESKLIFKFTNNRFIELPINFCNLKSNIPIN